MITLSDLSVCVKDTILLQDMNTSIAMGQMTGIIGPNGAGKSTLLRAVAGLMDYSGTITIDGRSLTSLSLSERARTIAYMPQGTDIHWPMTVDHIVGLGRYPHGMTTLKDPAPVDRAIHSVGIDHLRPRIATSLSGGEKALTLLARTLCVGSDIVCCDEPTASLDPRHQLQVLTLLKQSTRDGKTAVVVLHDLSLAQRFCDHLLLLDHGKLVASGDAETVLSDNNLRAVYGLQRGPDGFEAVDRP